MYFATKFKEQALESELGNTLESSLKKIQFFIRQKDHMWTQL